MKTPQFVQHCRDVSKLMKRLALLAESLDDECQRLTPSGGPFRRIKQTLLEAIGTTEAIRCAHLPEIEKEDPATAFVMGLALDHLVRKIGTMAELFRAVEMRSRPKYLTRSHAGPVAVAAPS